MYTTAVCNLNCVYCFIDKNPALQTIDQYLDDSFMKTPDYYINFAKEMFEQDKLEEIQIWGGEPFLAMHRAYYTIDKCINYFPNFKKIMISTNMVSDVFEKEFWGLIDVFRQYPNRQFTFSLQLSCDGPEYITDTNRGKGVTQKIIPVFQRLVTESQTRLPQNVTLNMHFKPTLDSGTIEQLQTEKSVLEYFRFFETFYQFYMENNKIKWLDFNLPIPNTACPSPHTVKDGKNFANYCKICRDIEKKKLLRYYKYITSFTRKRKRIANSGLRNSVIGHCGNGRSTLGLLPDNKVSCCHNGFVDMCAEYKKNIMENKSTHMNNVTIEKGLFTNQKNALMFDKDSKEFEIYQQRLEEFYDPNSSLKITNAASLVKLLADNNQLDAKYRNKQEAIDGAAFVLSHTAFCVRDGLGSTGSIYLYPVGLFKLLLNGAREYIEETEEKGDCNCGK